MAETPTAWLFAKSLWTVLWVNRTAGPGMWGSRSWQKHVLSGGVAWWPVPARGVQRRPFPALFMLWVGRQLPQGSLTMGVPVGSGTSVQPGHLSFCRAPEGF